MADKKIKVLVIDDAKFMVKAISGLLEADPDIEVIGTAKNGLEGLEKVKELQPDVITLDMDMPVMDGIRAIRHIMIEAPVPIVVLSSLFSDGSITFEALRLGVVDFVPKPSGAISRDIHTSSQRIIDRIKIATAVTIENIRRVRLKEIDAKQSLAERYGFQPLEYILTVGTTLTGPNTFIRLISNLSPQLPAATVITMDIAPQILESFVTKFDDFINWKVEIATEGTMLEQGTCYIASQEASITVQSNEDGKPYLKVAARNDYPIDLLFSTAAEVFKQHTVGLLLTGVGVDGAKGLNRIKELGGATIVQKSDTCVYPNLTLNAIENSTVDIIAEENELADEIATLMK